MRRLLLAFLAILCAGVAVAGNYPEHLLFKDYRVQSLALDSFYNSATEENGDPALIISKIVALEQWADKKDDLPLKYGFSIIKNKLGYNKKILSNSDFENALSELLVTLKQDKMQMHVAEVFETLAEYYWSNGKYALAFENYIRAYNIYKQYSQDQFPHKVNYTSDFGGKYYYFKDYGTAVHYFIEAVNADKRGNISLLNTLALCYSNMGNYDSAIYYFTVAYKLAEQRNELQWIGLLSGNLGLTYFLFGKSDLAMQLLEKELKINLEQHEGDKFNAANTLALLSEIYLQRNEKQKSLQLALQAYYLAKEAFPNGLPYEIQKRLYPTIARAYAANNSSEIAYRFLDSASVAKDTIAKRTNVLVLAGAQHNMDADKHLAQIQKYEHDQKIHALTRDILIAGILLLVAVGILIFRHEKVKARVRQEQLEAANKHAEVELVNASNQLKGFTESLSEKNDLIEKFMAEMARMQRDIDTGAFRQNETLQQLQHATILTDEQWRDFQKLFEKVHKGFMTRLNINVPGLSPVDKRFMLLSKLKLSKKEMSAMLGISEDAVLQNKQRIRHKLDIHEQDITIEEFADTI